jgi:hypothetical protein
MTDPFRQRTMILLLFQASSGCFRHPLAVSDILWLQFVVGNREWMFGQSTVVMVILADELTIGACPGY